MSCPVNLAFQNRKEAKHNEPLEKHKFDLKKPHVCQGACWRMLLESLLTSVEHVLPPIVSDWNCITKPKVYLNSLQALEIANLEYSKWSITALVVKITASLNNGQFIQCKNKGRSYFNYLGRFK